MNMKSMTKAQVISVLHKTYGFVFAKDLLIFTGIKLGDDVFTLIDSQNKVHTFTFADAKMDQTLVQFKRKDTGVVENFFVLGKVDVEHLVGKK